MYMFLASYNSVTSKIPIFTVFAIGCAGTLMYMILHIESFEYSSLPLSSIRVDILMFEYRRCMQVQTH